MELKIWLNAAFLLRKEFSVLETLFGMKNVEKSYYYWLNFVLLVGKYFISKCRKNAVEPCFSGFTKVLKSKIHMEKLIYQKRGKINLFTERFAYLYDNLYR